VQLLGSSNQLLRRTSSFNDPYPIKYANPVSLDGYEVTVYDGTKPGGQYYTIYLSGYAPTFDVSSGINNTVVEPDGFPRGEPNGMAFVDPNGTVIELLSYGGDFTATNGPALGLTSTDISAFPRKFAHHT
jgi:hypothetical protein